MLYKSLTPEKIQWSLEIDLWKDYSNAAERYLHVAGVKNINPENAVYEFYNFKKRTLERKPRNVVKSDVFHCPEKYEKALEEFEDCVRKYLQRQRQM